VTELRRFRNDDLPQLVQVWLKHFAASGIESRLTPALFEQAILNRTYFDPERLIVAVEAEQPVGLAAWLSVPGKASEAVVPAICAMPGEGADSVGLMLLTECETAARQAGFAILLGGSDPSHETGYTGLTPLGPGEGIADADRAAASWFMQRAFAPRNRIARYSVTLDQFRPPVDRMQMQLRRSTTVSSLRSVPENLRLAAALSHIDVERYSTVTRGGEEVGWAEFHLSDPEAQVFPTGHAILADWKSSSNDDQGATARYTISASLQQLRQRGVTRVEAVATDSQPDHAVTLRTLRFHLDSEGTVFSKRL